MAVPGVASSTRAAAAQSLRKGSTRAISTVPAELTMPPTGTTEVRPCNMSADTGRVRSKRCLGVRRRSTCANSESGTPPSASRSRATGMCGQCRGSPISSPCGHSCTLACTPCCASAITSSSMKAPWPMTTCRPKGSDSGCTRSRSQ